MNKLTRRGALGLLGGGSLYAGLPNAQSASGAAVSAIQVPNPSTGIRYVDVNGVRLAYEHHSSDARRPPLVFVHGYALRSTGEIYTSLIQQLTSQFDVYALDMRGHGASAAAYANWSQTALADDVAAFVDQLGLRGAVYAGHSLGGFTGLFSQIRHPGTFSALALLATAVASGGVPPPGLKEAFVSRGRDRVFAQEAFAPMYLRPNPDDVRRAADSVGLIGPSVHDAFFSNFAAHVLTARLGEIAIPVLLINGAKDTVVSPDQQHQTAAAIAWSKDVTFSSEGHMLPIEIPDATAREMLNFFGYDVGGELKRGT